MRERDGGYEGGLGCGERGGGGGEPFQGFWIAPEEICERFQRLCNGGEETPVKVDESQGLLELLDVLRRRELLNSGDVSRQRL
jgi:hypothetical protein